MRLTRITLGKSQAADLCLSDAYAWHQALWKTFPGRDGDRRDFLFRIDDAGTSFRLMMLSVSEPTVPVWGHWESKAVASSFLDHAAYRFQLKANPTMRRSRDGRRLGIYAEDRLHEWMRRKAKQHGFDVVENVLWIGAPQDEIFTRNNSRGKHATVDFRGVLRVRDRLAFREAFRKGIGSAKAFGCGLLMLQPVNI